MAEWILRTGHVLLRRGQLLLRQGVESATKIVPRRYPRNFQDWAARLFLPRRYSPNLYHSPQMRAARVEMAREMVTRMSAMPPGEQVEIVHAIKAFLRATDPFRKGKFKFDSSRKTITKNLSRLLLVTKKEGRYYCDQNRVDAMDFELWFGKGYEDELPIEGYLPPTEGPPKDVPPVDVPPTVS